MKRGQVWVVGVDRVPFSPLQQDVLRNVQQVVVPGGALGDALMEEIRALPGFRGRRLIDDEPESTESLAYVAPGAPVPYDGQAMSWMRWARTHQCPFQVLQGVPVSAMSLDGDENLRVLAWDDLEELLYPWENSVAVEALWSLTPDDVAQSSLVHQVPVDHRLQLVDWRGDDTCWITRAQLPDYLPWPGAMIIPPIGLERWRRQRARGASREMGILARVIHQLRAPGGCPWDQAQSHESLSPYLLEECHELLEAIAVGDPELLREELGDVLLQVMLHAVIAEESGTFRFSEVMQTLGAKMMHRHPHVFADTAADTPAEVESNWERIKEQEKLERTPNASLLQGVPATLPALLQAEKVQSVAARVGFDWDDLSGPLDKLREELGEFIEAIENQSEQYRLEYGDLLFSLVNIARFLEISPETELLKTVTRFRRRFAAVESGAQGSGRALSDLTLDEMDVFWEQAKGRE